VQQQIDKHLARAGVVSETVMVFNQIDKVIAMVGAGQGIAIVPSITLPAVWNRGVVMSRLIHPTVHLDWHQIRSRGKKLPVAAEDFTSFVQNYIARWAGRTGIL
jgi:DNA-binding transcriptional LysR family regulator